MTMTADFAPTMEEATHRYRATGRGGRVGWFGDGYRYVIADDVKAAYGYYQYFEGRNRPGDLEQGSHAAGWTPVQVHEVAND